MSHNSRKVRGLILQKKTIKILGLEKSKNVIVHINRKHAKIGKCNNRKMKKSKKCKNRKRKNRKIENFRKIKKCKNAKKGNFRKTEKCKKLQNPKMQKSKNEKSHFCIFLIFRFFGAINKKHKLF